jgi:hypothetical protein
MRVTLCVTWCAAAGAFGVACGGEALRTCESVCTPGARQCAAGDTYQTCGDVNADGCLEWSAVQRCLAGTACGGGACIGGDGPAPTPTGGPVTPGPTVDPLCHACSAGARTCHDGGWRACEDGDRDGCREWSGVRLCAGNTRCSEGACVMGPECCDAGARRCDGAMAWTCSDPDRDGCGGWGVPRTCNTPHQRCMDGACVATGTCGGSDDCGADDLCVRGRCRPVYGARYRVAPVGATLDATLASGEAYDSGGSDPDAYLILAIDGDDVLETAEAEDTLDPTWTESVELTLLHDQAITLALWDSDGLLNPDDLLGEQTLTGFPPEALRAGAYVWVNDEPAGFTLTLTLERIDN